MKNVLSILILIGTVLLVGLLSRGIFTGKKHNGDTVVQTSLRLKWVFDPGFAGEMVAEKLGFFKEENIDVDIRPGGFESDPIKLVASGADTFGVTGADNFLQAREKGVPIVAFAAGYLETPVVFYVREDSGISSPQDFVGKKVGYQAGQDTATVYEDLLSKLHIDRKSITEIPVQYDFGAFLSHQVDVWPGYAATQSYTLQEKNIAYRMIVPKDFGVSHMGTVYFASEETIKNHPEFVQAFVRGLIRGWKYTYGPRQDQAVSAIVSYDSQALTPDYVRFALEKQKSSVLPEGRGFCVFARKDWQGLYDSLRVQGLLGSSLDLDSAFTTRFVQ